MNGKFFHTNRPLILTLAAVAAMLVSVRAASVIDTYNDVGGATNGITLTTLNTTGAGGVGFTSAYQQTGSAVPVLRTNA